MSLFIVGIFAFRCAMILKDTLICLDLFFWTKGLILIVIVMAMGVRFFLFFDGKLSFFGDVSSVMTCLNLFLLKSNSV